MPIRTPRLNKTRIRQDVSMNTFAYNFNDLVFVNIIITTLAIKPNKPPRDPVARMRTTPVIKLVAHANLFHAVFVLEINIKLNGAQ